jgi:DNA-binding MarR family transcriptional regulator
VSQPTASRTLRRLEGEGLVRRRVDTSDGRVAVYDISATRRHDLAVLIDELATRLGAAA